MDSKKKNGKKNESTTETATDSKTVRVSRKDAVSLLGAMGFHAVHKASNTVLKVRLQKLDKYLETFEGTLTGDQDEIKDKVLKAGKDGFDVVGEEPKGAKAKDDQPNGPKANKGEKGKGKGNGKKKQPRESGPSNKEQVWKLYKKVKQDKALEHVDEWFKAIGQKVKLTTIRGWVSAWNHGKNLPGCANDKE